MEVNYMIAPGVNLNDRREIKRLIWESHLKAGRDKSNKVRTEKVKQDRKKVAGIAKIISVYFNEDIFLGTRKRETVVKRQLAHFLTQKLEIASDQSIAYEMGRLEHATIYHSIKSIENLLNTNSSIKNAFYEIKERNKQNVKKLITVTRSFNGSDKFSDLVEDLRAYIKIKFNQNSENEN